MPYFRERTKQSLCSTIFKNKKSGNMIFTLDDFKNTSNLKYFKDNLIPFGEKTIEEIVYKKIDDMQETWKNLYWVRNDN